MRLAKAVGFLIAKAAVCRKALVGVALSILTAQVLASSVTLSVSAGPYTAPASLTLTASPSATSGYMFQYTEFFKGGVSLGRGSSVTVSGLAAGSYSFSATSYFIGNMGGGSIPASSSIGITVNAPATTTTTAPPTTTTTTTTAPPTTTTTTTTTDGAAAQ